MREGAILVWKYVTIGEGQVQRPHSRPVSDHCLCFTGLWWYYMREGAILVWKYVTIGEGLLRIEITFRNGKVVTPWWLIRA